MSEPPRLHIDAERAGRDLAKLVVALVDTVRDLLERQAIRRMEGGHLSPEEIERLGLAFQQMEAQMDSLKTQFGLTAEDLHLGLDLHVSDHG